MLRGIGASEGIGIGKAVCIREKNLDYSSVSYAGREAEKRRLQETIEKFEAQTGSMAGQILERAGQKESEILTGQIAMLSDPFMQSQMAEMIESGQCAEAAVDQVCTMYAEMFAGVDDELMRQRAADVRDLRGRMLSILLGAGEPDLSRLPVGSVLVIHDLPPSLAVGLSRENIAAILTETGGKTSHSAILARALELPAVLGVPKAMETVRDGDGIIVDGSEGVVMLNPDQLTLGKYLKKQAAFEQKRAKLEVYRNRETRDADGRRYALYANIGSAAEAEAAAQAGAEGIGLFRTEFLFMDRAKPPAEAEQLEAYQAVSRRFADGEVIIRTLDIGGDKMVGYLGMDREDNPFLGHRAIRYCLDHPDLYRVQLRALLRAGAEQHNIKIMLPLVTSLEEIRGARALLEQCKTELEQEGHPYDREIRLGIMVETPAAALIADLLAQECDFFSIGTNDLTQYVMAVDRGNARVEKLYTVSHPAVLRSIRSVIQAAHAADIPVGMCGEAAADPRLIPLLMSWGLDEFSVGASQVLPTRAGIHRWRAEEAGQAAREAMSLSTSSGVQGYLEAIARP
ncbi:MAG: phosphoenolpyruvate--protein phosphotransferase [Oscillospiraceae bacterium]|nr:MAG: phosphoenolpyruvate--protein phosphotransferase [Oscillospiraceae bacterium]